MDKVPRQSPHGHCTFCDDIRQEISGKQTYVGVINGPDLYVLGSLPTSIGKFCIDIYFAQRPSEVTENTTIQIHFPGDDEDKPTGVIEVDMLAILRDMSSPPDDVDDPFIGIRSAIIFNPLSIKMEGKIKVHAIIGDKSHALGTLRVVSGSGLPVTKEAAN